MRKRQRAVSLAALGLGLALARPGVGAGQLTSEQVARLSADLTPVGAERAASADGKVPAWDGGLAATPVDPKTGYVDPYADDAALYTITAKNVDQYKDLLSAGHLALFKRDARTFKINVYPTHRSASYPEAVLAEIPKQATAARTDGYHVLDVGQTTVPFPIPADGLQVMWNHVFRWRGGSFERQIAWLPVAGTGKFFVVKLRQSVAFDQLGYMEEPRKGSLYRASNLFLSRPRRSDSAR
jgi:hypothetical protein